MSRPASKLKKQPTITKLFRRNGKHAPIIEKVPDDVLELEEEVKALEQRVRESQTELFQLQRQTLKHKMAPIRKKEETFVKPQTLMTQNSVEHMKRELQLLRMITGTEVTAYHAGDRCSVVFDVEGHTHGLRILINPAPGENQISSSDLPLGFNLDAVLEDYDNIMSPQCLGAVRKALVAYYNRLGQYQKLQKAVRLEAELFKTMDGSHIQISVNLKTDDYEESNQEFIKCVLMLDYRVSEIRPKSYTIQSAEDLPEGAADILTAKCAVFKKKPLDVAFKEAFLSDVGPYQMMQQGRSSPRVRRHPRTRPHRQTNNDDTFHPEECSEQSEDDVDE